MFKLVLAILALTSDNHKPNGSQDPFVFLHIVCIRCADESMDDHEDFHTDWVRN